MVAAGLALHIARFQLEYVGIEVGHAFGFSRPQREMADRIVLLPFALGVDLRAVLMALLRKVKIIAGRIVRTVTRKRPIAWPLDDLDIGIFFRYLVAHLGEVLDLDTEMIEPGLAAAAAGDD